VLSTLPDIIAYSMYQAPTTYQVPTPYSLESSCAQLKSLGSEKSGLK